MGQSLRKTACSCLLKIDRSRLNVKNIEIEMSETKNHRSSQEKWDTAHPEIVKESKAKYDEKNPVWSFRPTTQMLEWFEEERWDDNDGKPETNAALITRKLEKLMKMEQQGY
jgi:hypothetical protein